MSYKTIADMAESGSLLRRLVACAAVEKKTKPYLQWVSDNLWDIVASPGWSEKWESAVAAEIEDPGGNESVITDDDILAVIQPM